MRYGAIRGGGKGLFVNPSDITELGLTDGDLVDIVSEWEDSTRRVEGFRIVEYSTPRGNAAAYYPETNPLIPLDHVATKSNTPVSKAIVVRLEPATKAV